MAPARQSVPCRKEPSRPGVGALAVDERGDAVDDDALVPRRLLHQAHLASGVVPQPLLGSAVEPLVVVDDDVGRRALAQKASVLQPGGQGRVRRKPPVGRLQRHDLVFAHPVTDELRGIAGRRDELRVRPPVAHSRERHRRVRDLLHRLGRGLDQLRGEPDLEIPGAGDVQHGVDRVLALSGGDLADGEALVRLLDLLCVRGVARYPVDLDLLGHVAGAEESPAHVVELLHGLPPLRIGQLRLLLLDGPQSASFQHGRVSRRL